MELWDAAHRYDTLRVVMELWDAVHRYDTLRVVMIGCAKLWDAVHRYDTLRVVMELWDAAHRYSSGAVLKVTVTVVPIPKSLSMLSSASLIAQMCFTIARPRPVPPMRLECDLSTR